MIQYNAPAKVNLFLKVLGKREDGLHELFMLMEKIPLYDVLTFEGKREEILLFSDNMKIDEENLILRAAKAYFKVFNLRGGCSIHLEKNIPLGAGLGGGSSNAATTLLGLRDLYGHGKLEELEGIAANLGADVPFFLRQGACLARGTGTTLEQVRGTELKTLLLVKPKAGLSTAAVYRGLNEDDYRDSTVDGCLDAYLHKDPLFMEESINDLEKPAFRLMPKLKQIKETLGVGALMSGSGSTVFKLFEDPKSAEHSLEHLPSDVDTWIL